MRKGTRVRDKSGFLGKGTIVRKDKHIEGLMLVKWDKNPPISYNNKVNPSYTFDENLKILKKKKKV